MATSAEEPQPWDMESPMRSLGFHSSQVKVPPAASDVGPARNGGVGERLHHRLGKIRRRQGAHEFEAVVGPQVDTEAVHVRTDRRHVRRRDHPVGQRQRVGLLRGAATLGAAGVDAVYIDTVGAPRVALTAPASWTARARWATAPAASPATSASWATRLKALTASTLLAVSAATERS